MVPLFAEGPMTDAAVVKWEDTGVIIRSQGTGLSDISQTKCDSDGMDRQVENAFLITIPYGGGHRFNGEDFSPGCFASSRHYVLAYFDINKSGGRVATYHYYPKKPPALDGDPWKLTVINGRKYLERVRRRINDPRQL
jgi:hypothetical protein